MRTASRGNRYLPFFGDYRIFQPALQPSAQRRSTLAFSLFLAFLLLAGCGGTPQQKYARYLKRGRTLLEKSNAKSAILEFRGAIQLQPNEAEAYYWIAQGFLAEGNVRDGVIALRRATE